MQITSTWKRLDDLPWSRQLNATATDGRFVWLIAGGKTPAVNTGFAIDVAEIRGDGSLGPWRDAGARTLLSNLNIAAIVQDGWMYLLGGDSDTAAVSVHKINQDGTLGKAVPIPRIYGPNSSVGATSSFAYNGRLYHIHAIGDNITHFRGAYITKPQGLETGRWSLPTQVFPAAAVAHATSAAMEYKGYVYNTGGLINNATAVTSCWSARLDFAEVGPWQAAGDMLVGRWRHGGVILPDGTIFVAGGSVGVAASTATTSCEYAEISSPGVIGPFKVGPPLLVATRNARMIYANGWLYLFGGTNTATAS